MIAAKLNPGEVIQFGIVSLSVSEGGEERKWENGVSGGRERCSFDSSHYGKCSEFGRGRSRKCSELIQSAFLPFKAVIFSVQ